MYREVIDAMEHPDRNRSSPALGIAADRWDLSGQEGAISVAARLGADGVPEALGDSFESSPG